MSVDPIEPIVGQKYITVNGSTAQVTEKQGKFTYVGYVLTNGSPAQQTVWNPKGENQEEVEWDLVRRKE